MIFSFVEKLNQMGLYCIVLHSARFDSRDVRTMEQRFIAAFPTLSQAQNHLNALGEGDLDFYYELVQPPSLLCRDQVEKVMQAIFDTIAVTRKPLPLDFALQYLDREDLPGFIDKYNLTYTDDGTHLEVNRRKTLIDHLVPDTGEDEMPF